MTWEKKTPEQVLKDIDTLMHEVWASGGIAVIPEQLIVGPSFYSVFTWSLGWHRPKWPRPKSVRQRKRIRMRLVRWRTR